MEKKKFTCKISELWPHDSAILDDTFNLFLQYNINSSIHKRRYTVLLLCVCALGKTTSVRRKRACKSKNRKNRHSSATSGPKVVDSDSLEREKRSESIIEHSESSAG